MLLLVAACVDYRVEPEAAPPAPADVDVTPMALDKTGLCAPAGEEVYVHNVGEAPLAVTGLAVEGEGWSLDAPTLPVSLAGGERLVVPLLAAPGNATLVIETDDRDEPTVTIPLSAAANLAPQVLIASPSEEEFVDPDLDLVLDAFVSDTEAAPTELRATWVSDRIGEVAVVTPTSDGRVTTTWPASSRVSGPQVIQLQVADACDTTGEASVFWCQDGAWEVASVTENAWLVEGDSTVDQDAGTLVLGPGAAAAFDGSGVYDPEYVTVAFEVRTEGGAGFSLTALDTSRQAGIIGGDGCGLGFGDCGGGEALPGWSLAFDLEAGDGNDCGDAPSVGLAVDGATSSWAACGASEAGLDDGAWHSVRVAVEDGAIRVTVDGITVLDGAFPAPPSFPAFVGFTGASGTYEVREVRVTDYTCDCVEACDG